MMDLDAGYNQAVEDLLKGFGDRLKTVVLFGSRARGEAEQGSDHDLFLVIERLPKNPVERVREVRKVILNVPLRINTVTKTPEEVQANLTPLLLEICVDGRCLYGEEYFDFYRKRALDALSQSGLKRKRIGREWHWEFQKIPEREWELTWDGFRDIN